MLKNCLEKATIKKNCYDICSKTFNNMLCFSCIIDIDNIGYDPILFSFKKYIQNISMIEYYIVDKNQKILPSKIIEINKITDDGILLSANKDNAKDAACHELRIFFIIYNTI